MDRISRRFITPAVRREYDQLQRMDLTDDNIAQFIRDQYAHLNLDGNQIFQIFELLVNRQPNFEILKTSYTFETYLEIQF